jgi:hypothetical protein
VAWCSYQKAWSKWGSSLVEQVEQAPRFEADKKKSQAVHPNVGEHGRLTFAKDPLLRESLRKRAVPRST